jgi:hypothetical protein
VKTFARFSPGGGAINGAAIGRARGVVSHAARRGLPRG